MPAKLPIEFIKQSPPKLSDLAPGSQAYIEPYAMTIDMDHSIYLSRFAEIQAVPTERAIQVARDKEGLLHVNLLGRKFQIQPKNLEMELRLGVVIPVETVTC